MACRPAPACKAALQEATDRWPNRNKDSDGICASQKHSQQNPKSDHEPDQDGLATAFDIDHDPAGFDAFHWADQLRLRRDPRVKYVIFYSRMFASYSTSSRKAWEWGPYTGYNAHRSHMHVSVLQSRKLDTGAWWSPVLSTSPPSPHLEDPFMALSEAEQREILAIVRDLDKNSDSRMKHVVDSLASEIAQAVAKVQEDARVVRTGALKRLGDWLRRDGADRAAAVDQWVKENP